MLDFFHSPDPIFHVCYINKCRPPYSWFLHILRNRFILVVTNLPPIFHFLEIHCDFRHCEASMKSYNKQLFVFAWRFQAVENRNAFKICPLIFSQFSIMSCRSPYPILVYFAVRWRRYWQTNQQLVCLGLSHLSVIYWTKGDVFYRSCQSVV